jgi:hypothetical protein
VDHRWRSQSRVESVERGMRACNKWKGYADNASYSPCRIEKALEPMDCSIFEPSGDPGDMRGESFNLGFRAPESTEPAGATHDEIGERR